MKYKNVNLKRYEDYVNLVVFFGIFGIFVQLLSGDFAVIKLISGIVLMMESQSLVRGLFFFLDECLYLLSVSVKECNIKRG